MSRLYKKRRLFKKVIFCLCVLLASPLIASLFVRVLPTLTAAAEKTASISAGLVMGEAIPRHTEAESENDVSQGNSLEIPEESADSYRPVFSSSEAEIFSSENDIPPSQAELNFLLPLIPSAEDEDKIVPDTEPGPQPYPDKLEERSGSILSQQYGRSSGTQFFDLSALPSFSLSGGAQIRNNTKLDTGILIAESEKLPVFSVALDGSPQVLIMHTHTTESYEPYDRDFYDASFTSRTTDASKNMTAVGDAITEQLQAAGIGVIHDTTIHDYPSYNGSYDRSAATVKKILDQYPTIKVVLDVHRDAIERQDGVRVAPVATIQGKASAQVMIISGCDDGSMNMPNYLQNFRMACLLQRQMESDFPGLTRPVLFTYKKYNQDLTTGSLLIEVGGHANSIQQAVYAGELVGKSLASALKKLY